MRSGQQAWAMEVALFITCLTDTFEPRVGVAIVRLLRHFGCRVHFPPEQTCCGQPQYNNGYHAEAAKLGRRMVDIFGEYDYVVSPSGSCVNMVKHHTPELLKGNQAYAERARRLAERTYEFGQFVTDVLRIDPAGLTVRDTRPVTFHYSCHMRGLQTPEHAGRLVEDLDGIDYRPVERIDQCCGFGGAFHVLYPQISQAIVEDKLSCIEKTGAAVVICNEAGCAMTIGGAAHRRGLNVKLKHVAELWAEALGLMEEEP
jgi:L-lactate dehydrogenase complex protein LldE